jgi:hypothetical protein
MNSKMVKMCSLGLLELVLIINCGCHPTVTTTTPKQLSDAQISNLRQDILERLRTEQAQGELPQMDPTRLAAAVDATLAQVASVKSWSVTKGGFLGFTIGDSQEEALGKLKSLGAEYVLGESATYGPVTAAFDLGRLNDYSDFLLHPINARVVLQGDHVQEVTVPPECHSPICDELRTISSRKEVFSLFSKFLTGGGRWIEPMPAPQPVDIRSDQVEGAKLLASNSWITDFRDIHKRSWQLTLRFDNERHLVAVDAVTDNQ